MELNERTKRVHTNGLGEINNFTIKASAKAFSILSSGLYSDKISAIIRELSTNAYDSHVMAGNTKPFDVHLPTIHDKTFYIRDYGTGLSEDDINHIYTTYFESNKTKNNDVVGCLGLGSKSPFSYTDSFNVISYFNGVEYTYQAFINANGIPTITKFGERNTNEPNGLKISFLVKDGDRFNFYHKAINIYKWFDIVPNFVGEKIDVQKPKISDHLPHDKNWYFSSDISGLTVVMGNVAYPVTLNDTTLQRHQQELIKSPLVLHCNIGDVDIEASREGLSYCPRTISNIKLKLSEIYKHITKYIEVDIDNSKNLWEAYFKHYKNKQFFERIISLNNIKYKNQIIPEYISVESKVTSGDTNYNLSIYYRYFGKNKTVISSLTKYSFSGHKKYVFIINDLKRGTIARTKLYMESQKADSNTYYCIISKNVDEFFKQIHFDKSDAILASSLNKHTPSKRPSNIGVKDKIVKFYADGHTPQKRWQELSVDSNGSYAFPKTIIYVPISNWNVVDIENNNAILLKSEDLIDLLKSYNYLFPNQEIDIYGIRAKFVKEITSSKAINSTFVHLKDFIKNLKYSDDIPTNSEKYRIYKDCSSGFASFSNFYTKISSKANIKLTNINTKIDNLKKICLYDNTKILHWCKLNNFINSKNKYIYYDSSTLPINQLEVKTTEMEIKNVNQLIDSLPQLLQFFKDKSYYIDSALLKDLLVNYKPLSERI